jgi:hexokinase
MPLKSSTKDIAEQSILVIDVGGTSFKVLASGQPEKPIL